jgi:hypothetical protein
LGPSLALQALMELKTMTGSSRLATVLFSVSG